MVYVVVFIVLYALRNFAELVIQPKKRIQQLFKKVRKKGLISITLLTLGSPVSAASVAYLLFKEGPNSMVTYITGIALFLAGFAGRAASVKELGLNYSQDLSTVPDADLVDTGIYSRIRHPIYLSYIIEMGGYIIIKFNYVSLAAAVIVILNSVYRMKVEEKFLSQAFGSRFEAYRGKTRRLIPFIF